jgi:cardiolipin synthase
MDAARQNDPPSDRHPFDGLIRRLASADFSTGNMLRLLVSGTDYFPALLAAIEAAQTEIHLETYIFADDATGRQVAAALGRAAKRGVVVRVMVDGFGSRSFLRGLGAALIADGAQVLVYRPEIAPRRIRRYRLRRLHRKLSVFDGRIAFVGGINIIDDFSDVTDDVGHPLTAPRLDYAVRIEGPLVADVLRTMQRLWHMVQWTHTARRPPKPPTPTPPPPAGNMRAMLLIRDNLRHRRDIENAYLHAIDVAQREILLAHAYFLPGGRFRETLCATARRGVAVTLLLQGRVEYRFQYRATQALYDQLLAAGVRIFEYQPAFLHAKVAVIDDDWATVGSSNIDPFSLLLSREANVIVRDATFATTLRTHLQTTIASSSREVRPDDGARRHWLTRLRNRLAYFLVRLLVGLTHYADYADDRYGE